MARTAGRDADDTRRVILEAAARLIARRGAEVPLSAIAEAAGVSKGGLLYHFPTKEALMIACAQDLFTRFREAVLHEAERELADVPGRLARAYIRVSFSGAALDGVREVIGVAAQLAFEEVVQEMAIADGRRWREDLHADGLPARVVRLIVAATDGVSSAPLWGEVLNARDRAELQDELLAMTRS